MIDHLLSAFQALSANKVRAALTMLGVIIGVLAVTLLVSVGDGARGYVDETLRSIGTNLLFIVPGHRETRGGMSHPQAGSSKPLTMDDVTALERQTSLLRSVCPVIEGGGTIRYAGRQRDTLVFGVGPSFTTLRNMPVNVGTFIRQEDLDSRRRVVVLGRTVVRELFGDENPLGKPVRIADGRFRVVGIMAPKGTSLGFDMDDLVFVSATAAQDLFGQESLSQIMTAARSKDEVTSASAEIEETLARRRGGDRTFTIQSQDDLMSIFGSVTSALTWTLLAIASISLVVGGIGIMNIMLVSVRERTREIGVRRALGATRMDVLFQFLIESLALATLGGATGLGLGAGVIGLAKRIAPTFPLHFSGVDSSGRLWRGLHCRRPLRSGPRTPGRCAQSR